MYYSQVEVSALVLNHLSESESNLVSEIMMSKIMKAIDVEVNKRLELYLVNFIKYNYENGSGQHEGFVRPSDEEIEGHITSYMKMTPFSLEEKVVEKKRMGRPKKNEKEVIVAEEEMFGNLTGNVSDMKLEHPDNIIPPVVDHGVKEAAPKAKKEKVVKEKKEKVVKEKVEKAPKEKKEKVVKEKVEKAPKEKKAKVTKAVKNGEEENLYAINDDGVVNSPKEKVKKAKKEKVVKEKVESEKKRGRPKKGEEKAKSDTEEDSEEELGQLAVQLQELCVVAEQPPQQQTPKQSAKEEMFQSAHAQVDDAQVDDDEVAFEEYEEVEDEDEEELAVSTPKTEPQDHIVKFTDKNSGIDYFIDKQMVVENEDAAEGETWYAVKHATTRAVVGRSNLRQMELFDEDDEDDEDDDDEDEEEEEEEEEEED